MCAICGIFDFTGAPIGTGLLGAMLRVQEHRGPDGSGTFVEGSVGLGHRRLSIIDLGGGAQPISNEDENLQIVFNGEIYNFIELRKELEAFGHRFKTHSDTEVILHAYEQWGADSLRRLNGMFAFAIWDRSRGELFIARDHLGIKPLYHTTVGNQFVFASEIKAVLEHPDYDREVDLEALAELFTFRYVPSPKTLLKRIFKVPPGHYMRVSAERQDLKRFWTWVPQIRKTWNERALVEEYQSLLEDAIRIQLRSDVPLGLFLSSGVDSGVLLAVMSQYTSGPVRSFTIGFEDGGRMNEVSDAALMARRFGADHQAQLVTAADYGSYFERYMSDLEEPVGHESAAAFYFVSKLARQQVKVALTGQGADEPWAGYDRYIGVKLSGIYSRMPRLLTGGLAPLIARLPGRLEKFKRGVASLSEPDTLTRFTKIYSFFSAEMKAQLYRNGLREPFLRDSFGTKEALRHLQTDVQHLDLVAQMLYIDSRASLPDDLLMVGDKTSMANSLEVRVPFLDFRLVEFIESLPSHLKLNGLTGKYLHKKAMTKWLPQDVIYRKKKGFSIPLGHWLRTSLRGFVDDALLSQDSHIARYFDQEYIRSILERDRSGAEQFTRHIYLLLSLELWHRSFIGAKTSKVATGV
jgi:asparagine synthase (glutamine-hydrolysing)